MKFVATLLVGAALTGGCGRNETPQQPGAKTDGRKTFQVKGVVKEVLPARKQVQIEHEKIPDYMDAMTMLFDVKDTNELTGLQPGDNISFRMIVTDDDGWIDQIKRLGTTTPIVANAPENFRRAREVDPLKVGDAMPNYHFTNQVGQAVSLSDFKGQAVALTFIFTIDPAFDTPSVLKKYATQYRYDPKHWSFVTGQLIDITALAEQFGLLFWRPDPNQTAGINHNLRTVVVTASGKVHKVLLENQWTGTDLASAIVEAAKL